MVYPYQQNFQQGYPQTFPTYPGNVPNTPVQPTPQGQAVQQPPMQIQNGGFVGVRSINEAFTYPVAPGNAVTFRDETAPYIYEKTQGFSQLERPVFKKFRLVEETADAPQVVPGGDISPVQTPPVDLSSYVKTADFEAFAAKYNGIPAAFEQLSQLVNKLQFDVDAISDKKSTKKIVQAARKDAEEE